MPRTTIDLPADQLRALKERAASEGTTLSRLVSDLLRWVVARPTKPKYRFHLTVHRGGGGVLPGVDIADRNSLYDVMDGPS